MCIAPQTLEDGTQVACRECWQCRKARVDDWCGRGIAELRTCKAAHAVTLTYGRDRNQKSVSYGEAEHERAAVLTYSDVQKFLKLLRRHGFPCRYIVTGEYGSRKGRAHWHVLLFWQDKVPPGIELGKNLWFARYNEDGEEVGDFWPHGHTFWQAPEYEHFRYNLKYILKEQGSSAAEQQGKLVMSKVPPLGSEYFVQRAWKMARQGLVPLDGTYTFPEAVRRNGERVLFRMSETIERIFIEAYMAAWDEVGTDRHPPYSEWLYERLEKRAAPLPLIPKQYWPMVEKPWRAELRDRLAKMIGEPVAIDALYFLDGANAWAFTDRNGGVWQWRLENEAYRWLNPDLEKNQREWQRVWRDAVAAARQTSRPWEVSPGSKPRRERPAR